MKSNKTDNNNKVCFINGRGYKMAGLKKLPIGIENFEEMRREDFYYVDKSHVIEQLLTQWGKVNLFTRPRRFGKTMGMSMLPHFFDIRSDNRRLFDGLEIIYDEALCSAWMNLFKELKSGSAGKIQVGQSLHTMSTALKDNTTLRFVVITGCLKIAKESIFTGTNNFVPDNITDSRFNEYFGFTQEEVDQILTDANVSGKAEEVKRWYDGYHFGRFDVYCPWDVMNYMRDLQQNPEAAPASRKRNKNKKMQVTVSYITVTCIFLFVA